MAAIQTIFWDIGGVLLTNGWDRNQRRRVLTELGVDLAEYEERHDAANYYWERGLSTEKEFFDKTIFYKSRSFTLEQLWKLIEGEQKVLFPESFEILRELRASKRYKIATLNNESRELNELRLRKFDLRQYFDFFICSGYVGEMKPHLDIYREAVEVSGCAPEETVFIDDKQENAEAASALGMHGIRFVTPEGLRMQLAQLGVGL